MLCYKDKTFCASKVLEHTCGRVLTKAEEVSAMNSGLPVAYANFCKDPEELREEK